YSDLRAADAEIAITKRQMENAEALFKNGISSQREYEEAKQNYEKALSAANKIREQLHINGAGRTDASGNYVIVAPRSGYVLEKLANFSIENKEGQPALCIPSTAIVSDFGKNYVIRYRGNCDLEIKEISILKTISGNTFLSGGLQDGDRILSSNQVLFFRALM